MTESRFALYISDRGEELETDTGEHRKFPLLGLLGEYTRAFHPVLCRCQAEKRVATKTEVWKALATFTTTVAGDQMLPDGFVAVYEKPYRTTTPQLLEFFPSEVKEYQDEPWFWFWSEYLAIRGTVPLWLEPQLRLGGKQKYLAPRERYLLTTLQVAGEDIWASALAFVLVALEKGNPPDRAGVFMDTLREEAFRFRTRQVGTEILATGPYARKVLTHKYRANSLLPLVWTEILWAIENGQYARFCDICGAAFHLTRPYTRKVYICPRKECVKARRVQVAGGEEAVREKNREAQRKSRERLKRGERLRKRGFGPNAESKNSGQQPPLV